jgi:lysophospholipase L1-like esterase
VRNIALRWELYWKGSHEINGKKNKNLKVVALGDSITQGYPFDMEASWVYILKMEKGLDIVNKGINGDTLEGMLERFERDVISLLPGMVIIMGGTNDAFKHWGKLKNI